YRVLFDRYQRLADATAALGAAAPPADLAARVIAAADRWRTADGSDAPCEAAARVFRTLGLSDLAWDYLTTRFANGSDSTPVRDLAEQLRQAGDAELADRAYVAAWNADPQDAQLLWDRAPVQGGLGRR